MRARFSSTGDNICHIAWSCHLEICRFRQKSHKRVILVIFFCQRWTIGNSGWMLLLRFVLISVETVLRWEKTTIRTKVIKVLKVVLLIFTKLAKWTWRVGARHYNTGWVKILPVLLLYLGRIDQSYQWTFLFMKIWLVCAIFVQIYISQDDKTKRCDRYCPQ